MTDIADPVRPVHTVVDCSGVAGPNGRRPVAHTPLSDAEVAAQLEVAAAAVAAERERLAEDGRVRALVAAHPDPLVQLLARRAGLA